MQRLRGWILPGMGWAVILTIIAHNTMPGGLPLPEPSPIDGKPPPPMPGWAWPFIFLSIPFLYPLVSRFNAWVSGEPRR
jgi:hypothetical protein